MTNSSYIGHVVGYSLSRPKTEINGICNWPVVSPSWSEESKWASLNAGARKGNQGESKQESHVANPYQKMRISGSHHPCVTFTQGQATSTCFGCKAKKTR